MDKSECSWLSVAERNIKNEREIGYIEKEENWWECHVNVVPFLCSFFVQIQNVPLIREPHWLRAQNEIFQFFSFFPSLLYIHWHFLRKRKKKIEIGWNITQNGQRWQINIWMNRCYSIKVYKRIWWLTPNNRIIKMRVRSKEKNCFGSVANILREFTFRISLANRR